MKLVFCESYERFEKIKTGRPRLLMYIFRFDIVVSTMTLDLNVKFEVSISNF